MNTTRRRQVRCHCAHTCGALGVDVSPSVAKSHAEKALRLQSRARAIPVAAAPSATRPIAGRAHSPGMPHHAVAPTPSDAVMSLDPSLGPSAAEVREMSRTDADRPLSAGLPSYSRELPPTPPQDIEPDTSLILDCDAPVSARDLLHLVGSFEVINAASAAGSVPLTQRVATTPPVQSDAERRLTRAYRRAMEDAECGGQDDENEAEHGLDDFADVDGGFGAEEDDDGDDNAALPEEDDDDDPFRDDTLGQAELPRADLDPVLVMVYTVVTWLHLQWHLPRAPCHVLLHVFSLLFLFLGHPHLYHQSFVTLKAARRALGTDVKIQVLPVCPSCRDVFPSVNSPDRCPRCDEALFRTVTRHGKRIATDTPIVKYPFCPISAQLSAVLAQPGVEEACDAWRKRSRTTGEYHDVFDGRIARELKAHDGSLFWRNGGDCLKGPDGELRLGVMWGLDWFSHIVSNTAPSHSSCPTSFSIANLPVTHRFRTSNLLCTSILPGPKEQSPDQVQRFIRPIVSDLVRLWKEGVVIPTPSCPEGRRVRVILLALVCDKPAAHKVGGFGSHSHRFFCHCCWCKSENMSTPEAFAPNGYSSRTDKEQRALGEKYRQLQTKGERDAFVKEHATRYTQLSRLPYFDLVRQVVIDPMHNLALGLVKTQFYHIWVQSGILTEAKLRMLHELIAECEVPAYLGRLPTEIGVPAGGSLTADQWIILATVMGPLTIPQLWEEVLASSSAAGSINRLEAIALFEEQKKAALAAHAQERARQDAEKAAQKERQAQDRRRTTSGASGSGGGEPASATQAEEAPTTKRKRAARPKIVPDSPFTMHPDDPAHFQKLSTALHILLRHSLTDGRIDEAERLLREYCADIVRLYGSSHVRPNHHYATHVAQYARDFGPLCGFWTFLFERLNRVLKSYNTNNHGNGEIETTFFTEFLRTCSTSRLIYRLLSTPQGSITNLGAEQMLKSTHEERGTVAGLAQLASDLTRDSELDAVYQLSTAYQSRELTLSLFHTVLQHLQRIRPDLELYSPLGSPPSPSSRPLHPSATFYPYVVVRNRRYHASHYNGTAAKSLVAVTVPASGDGPAQTRVCEILDILLFMQPGTSLVCLWAHVRWFLPYRATILSSAWQSSPYFNRQLWVRNMFDTSAAAPPPLLDVMSILHHVARVPVVVEGEELWATIGIDKDS